MALTPERARTPPLLPGSRHCTSICYRYHTLFVTFCQQFFLVPLCLDKKPDVLYNIGMERYLSFDTWARQTLGQKVYRLSIATGFG